jgi:hypothetical protein
VHDDVPACRRSAIPAARPPMPAPTISALRCAAMQETERSGFLRKIRGVRGRPLASGIPVVGVRLSRGMLRYFQSPPRRAFDR